MITNMKKNTLSNLNYFAGWASLNQFAQEFLKPYRQDILFAGSKKENNIPIFKNRYKEDETLIYVCKNCM